MPHTFEIAFFYLAQINDEVDPESALFINYSLLSSAYLPNQQLFPILAIENRGVNHSLEISRNLYKKSEISYAYKPEISYAKNYPSLKMT